MPYTSTPPLLQESSVYGPEATVSVTELSTGRQYTSYLTLSKSVKSYPYQCTNTSLNGHPTLLIELVEPKERAEITEDAFRELGGYKFDVKWNESSNEAATNATKYRDNLFERQLAKSAEAKSRL
ncbi:uncharacterized protein L201_002530 [Kwoniella dendrophila CBS 6074]|uniref:Uncharacterized protein n=1 Tax=Kwoniella dendrophila CBS 6074 TaxID=1295534 RepID=A0AAX4JQE9_9TREE